MPLPPTCPMFPGLLMVLMLVDLFAFCSKFSLPVLQRNALKAASILPRSVIAKPLEKSLLLEQEAGCIPLKFVAVDSHYYWWLIGLWITRKATHIEVDTTGMEMYAGLLSSSQPHPIMESQKLQHSHLQRRGHQSKEEKKKRLND